MPKQTGIYLYFLETHIRITYPLESAGEQMLIKELHFWSENVLTM